MRAQGVAATVAMVALTMSAAQAAQAAWTNAIDLITRECSACHGARGSSISPLFPKLAGQHAEYLEAQLKAFRDRSRADPHAQAFMWGMAAQLTDSMIKEIAAYFASQAPPRGRPGDPEATAAGQRVYEEGLPADGVQACQNCHLKMAQGHGAFPRLAGQHRDYLERQLRAFASNLRDNAVMREVVRNLTASQIHQVATFLSGLDVGADGDLADDRQPSLLPRRRWE